MADVEIKGRLSVDTGNTGKSISDIKKEIKDAGKAMEDAAVGSDAWTAANRRLTTAQQSLKQATDQTNAANKTSSQHFGELKDRVTAMVPGLKGVEAGAGGVNTIFKILSANPIILILTALVGILKFLYEAFTATREGAEKVEAVFEGVKAAVQVVTDRVMMLGRAVIEFFKGNFKGAVEQAKGAVTGLVDEVQNAYNRAKSIAERLQEIRAEDRMDRIEDAENDKKIAQMKERLNDDEVTAKEKLKTSRELRSALLKDQEEDDKRNSERIDLELQKIRMKRNLTKEDLDAEAELLIERSNLAKDNALEEFRLTKMVHNAEKQVAAEAKAAADAAKEAAKNAAEESKKAEDAKKARLKELADLQEGLLSLDRKTAQAAAQAAAQYEAEFKKQDELEEARRLKIAADNKRTELENKKKLAELKLLNNPKSENAKIEAIKANLALELSTLAEGDLQKQILTKKAEDEITKIKEGGVTARKELDKAEYESKMQTVTAVGGILTSLSNLVGQQTAVGKGLAVAGATIDTFAAVAATLKNAAKTPAGGIPGYAILQAAAVGINGIAAVRNILKVQVPGGGGGGSAPSAITASAPLAPQASSTALNQSSINAVGNAASGGIGRSFVLDSDIKNNDERARVINRRARL